MVFERKQIHMGEDRELTLTFDGKSSHCEIATESLFQSLDTFSTRYLKPMVDAVLKDKAQHAILASNTNQDKGRSMVRLPATFKLGAHVYKVEFPYHFKERNDLQAQCDNAELKIRINDREPGGQIRPDTNVLQSYFHELLHAIDATFLQGQLGKTDLCEVYIDGLAEGLTQVFCDGNSPSMEADNDH
jgi:hypothetical protein